MIEIIDKHTAKLIVNIGSGKTRKRRTKTVRSPEWRLPQSGKRELNQLYREFEAKCKRSPSSKIKVKELVESYIKHKELLGAKATTLRGYRSAAKRIYSSFEGVSAGSLAAYQIEDLIAEMADNELSSKTIINTISILNAAYSRAVKTGQLSSNPCQFVTLPKRTKPEYNTFNTEELFAFTKQLEKERLDYNVGYSLCLFCGMRRSEVLGLRESDIDFENCCLTISNTRHRVKGDEDIIQDTKTISSHRTLAIPELIMNNIKALIEEHHNNPYNQTDFIIQNGFGEPISPSTFTKYIHDVEDAAGVSYVSVHELRHTFATILNSEGVDIARISAELGHSTIGTTLNIYTHIFGDVSTSSKGIASSMNEKISKSATFVPPEDKEKTADN